MRKGSHHSKESIQKDREHNSGKNNPMYGKTNEQCPVWKGDKAGYGAIHYWVKRRKTKPLLCENCSDREPVELANLSLKYKRDIDDYMWLCKRCHQRLDGHFRNLKQYNIDERRDVA